MNHTLCNFLSQASQALDRWTSQLCTELSAEDQVAHRYKALATSNPYTAITSVDTMTLQAKSTILGDRHPLAANWLKDSHLNEAFQGKIDACISLWDASSPFTRDEWGKELLGCMLGRLIVFTERADEVPKDVMEYCWELTHIAKDHVIGGREADGTSS